MTTDSPAKPGVAREVLLSTCDHLLQPSLFKDYGPNGLQVEGRPVVRKLVSGVTASLALIDAAIEVGADTLLVHHGLFWRGQDGRITGWMRQRLSRLLSHDINLLAYHLPLDAHPTLGNNAQLALRLGVALLPHEQGRFGDQALGFMGLRSRATASQLAEHAQTVLGRSVLLVGEPARPVERVALVVLVDWEVLTADQKSVKVEMVETVETAELVGLVEQVNLEFHWLFIPIQVYH